jgi:pimeloyl-ACP methyl ester carboxylesterase
MVQLIQASGGALSTRVGKTVSFMRLKAAIVVVVIAVQGSGPKTLICVHGSGIWSHSFRQQISLLKEHYRVLALDLPGHGHTIVKGEPTSEKFTFESFVTMMDALFDALGIRDEEAVLVGHSMGEWGALGSGWDTGRDMSVMDTLWI